MLNTRNVAWLAIGALWLAAQSPSQAQTAEQWGLDRGVEGGEELLVSFLLTLSLSVLGGILVWVLAGIFIDYQMERFTFRSEPGSEWTWKGLRETLRQLADTPRWRRFLFLGGVAFLGAVIGVAAFGLSAGSDGSLFETSLVLTQGGFCLAAPIVVVLTCAVLLWKHYSEAKWERHAARMAYAEESKTRGPAQDEDPDRFRKRSGLALFPMVSTLAVASAAAWHLVLVSDCWKFETPVPKVVAAKRCQERMALPFASLGLTARAGKGGRPESQRR